MTLDEWRKSEGLSYQQLADLLEKDVSFVVRLCNGKRRPGPNLYERIFFVTEGRVAPNDFFPLAMWAARLSAVLSAARQALLGEAA